MASGPKTTHRADMHRTAQHCATFLVAACAGSAGAKGTNACENPVDLTLDTGHMAVAPLMADVLQRNQVHVTFFVANERTKTGDGSLGNDWAPWWKSMAAEGHEFASHTYDHVVWRGDLGSDDKPTFRMRPTAGASEGRESTWDASQYCEQITHATRRVEALTGKKSLPLFRAPGGKTSERLLAVARACGYAHVGWASAGFLGDDFPSEKYSNDMLLQKALRDIRKGDIL